MQIITELAPWDNSPSYAIVSAIVYPTGREGTARSSYAGCVGYFSFGSLIEQEETEETETDSGSH